jgi:hypothetical protein
LKLLLDEMYSAVHAAALQAVGIQAATVIGLGLAGSSDPEVFAAATAEGSALLTENVADFTRISAEHLLAGQHHRGVLIALSSRFSRRPAGIPALVAAITALAERPLTDCLIYLQAPAPRRSDRGGSRHAPGRAVAEQRAATRARPPIAVARVDGSHVTVLAR